MDVGNVTVLSCHAMGAAVPANPYEPCFADLVTAGAGEGAASPLRSFRVMRSPIENREALVRQNLD